MITSIVEKFRPFAFLYYTIFFMCTEISWIILHKVYDCNETFKYYIHLLKTFLNYKEYKPSWLLH